MLDRKEKIKIFISILSQEEVSYADGFNAHIGLIGGNCSYNFLEKLKSAQDIEKWIEKLKNRIVMREDESVLEDIIDNYILCG